MLSHGLGLISFVPNLAPSHENVHNRGHFIFLLVVSWGLHVLDALTNTSVSGVGTATHFPNANKPPNSLLDIGPKTSFTIQSTPNCTLSIRSAPNSGQSLEFSSILIRLSRKVLLLLFMWFVKWFSFTLLCPRREQFLQ